MQVHTEKQQKEHMGKLNLGPEFWPQKRNALWWKNRIRSSRAVHKQLIDQKVVAGIGNIIAIEILHKSGLLPQSNPKSFLAKDWSAIARNAQLVVNQSHAQHTAFRESVIQEDGFFRGELKLVSEGNIKAKGFSIYGRAGILCPKCSEGRIQKSKLAARPIYWCPVCQK